MRLINGVVYQEKEDVEGNTQLKYVLPIHTVDRVLEALHSTVYGAHLGRKKTKAKALERFYRPFFTENIVQFVKSCDTCQKIKTLAQKTRAEMILIKPERINKLIASDFAGPLNVTPRGNKYIQVITDLFNKYLLITTPQQRNTERY